MQQNAFTSRRAGLLAEARSARLRDIAAAVLALALLFNLCRSGDDESFIVSLAGIDTAIVVALPAAGSVPPRSVADTIEPVVARPVELSALPRIETILPPGSDLAPAPAPGAAQRTAVALVVSRALASVVGIASTYNPFRRGAADATVAAVAPTASGETYDPDGWTAAIQIDRRHDFGGVRYGRLYRPAFALVERGDKRVIVRINDVGPLRPGRVIDLNERSMRYFDPTMELGLLPDMKITLLRGDDWTAGPLEADARTDPASAM